MCKGHPLSPGGPEYRSLQVRTPLLAPAPLGAEAQEPFPAGAQASRQRGAQMHHTDYRLGSVCGT